MQRLIRAGPIVLLAGVFILFSSAQVTPPSPVILEGISPTSLEFAGVTLLPPGAGERAGVGEDTARMLAEGGFGAAPIRQVVLAHVKVPSRVPALDQLMWVVNFDPAGVTLPAPETATLPASSPRPAWFALDFIDANTGQDLYAMSPGIPVCIRPTGCEVVL